MIAEYRFELFADYFQFYLEDEGVSLDMELMWDDDQLNQLLAVHPGLIAVGTARNMTVPVRVEIREGSPEIELKKWDKINECSIRISTGKIVVMGCTDYYPEAARIKVTPGVYRVRVHYGGLDRLSEDGLEGEDHYEVILWAEGEERETKKIE